MATFTYDYVTPKMTGKIGSKEHLKALHHFRDLLKLNILGEQDKEWRTELEHICKCTERDIRRIEDAMVGTRLV